MPAPAIDPLSILPLLSSRWLAGWLAGWLRWRTPKVIHIHLHTHSLTIATALQQSPADACMLHLYYCRRRASSCMTPTTPSTPVYCCYECRRAEWPADGARFGETDARGKAIITSPNISFVDTACFFVSHPSIHPSALPLFSSYTCFLPVKIPQSQSFYSITSTPTTPT